MVTWASGYSFWTAMAIICAVVWRTLSKFGLLSFVGRSKPNRSSAVVSPATATSSASIFVLIWSLFTNGNLGIDMLECNDLLITAVVRCLLLHVLRMDEPILLFLNDMDELMK
jgi:hypothetical protein